MPNLASVSLSQPYESCQGNSSFPSEGWMEGAADTIIHYGGGTLAGYFGLSDPNALPYPGAVATVEEWASHNGCDYSTVMGPRLDLDQGLAGNESAVTRYMARCRLDGSVDLWTIQGGVHIPDLGP